MPQLSSYSYGFVVVFLRVLQWMPCFCSLIFSFSFSCIWTLIEAGEACNALGFFFTCLMSHWCTLGVSYSTFEKSLHFSMFFFLCEKCLSLWFPGVSSHRNSFVTPPNSQILMTLLPIRLCSYLYQGMVHYDVFFRSFILLLVCSIYMVSLFWKCQSSGW